MIDPNAVWDQSKIEHKRALLRMDGLQQLADLENRPKLQQPEPTQNVEQGTGMIQPQGNFGGFRVSQAFGNYNPGLYAGRTKGSKHWGLDIATPEGTPLRNFGGNVTYGQSPDFGNYATVEGPDGIQYQFSHLSKRGEGDIIGYTGNTGHSTGAHLDIMAKKNGQYIDPTTLESLKRLL